MAAENRITIRFQDNEIRTLTARARESNKHLSAYIRDALFSTASRSGDANVLDEIGEIRSALAEIKSELHEAAKAYATLAQKVAELVRVPTFREFRSRALVEGIKAKPGEPEHAYLLRVAQAYYALYQRWPDAANRETFGPVSQEFDLNKFPRSPV